MIQINWNQGFYAITMGMIGAVIITLFMQWVAPKPTLATVNLTGIVNGFIQSQTKQSISAAELKDNMKLFSNTLDIVLHQIVKKRHVVLVPEQAVVTGSPDVTNVVMQNLRECVPQFFEEANNNRNRHG